VGKKTIQVNQVFVLSLHGSVAFVVVWTLDLILANSMGATYRRWWWIAIPLSFLVAIRVPILPMLATTPMTQAGKIWPPLVGMNALTHPIVLGLAAGMADFVFAVWLTGGLIYLLVVAVQTRTALRRWSRERLSTDSSLLDTLEDCKQAAGIMAPIGLVISNQVSAPALLGWLRPRILLPAHLVASLSKPQLRAVIFHELAHFRSLDIPLNWLFTLACAVHWFNPVAHLAFGSWARFREEAADETAINWMREPAAYGEARLQALRQTNGGTSPYGALTIGESINNLKRRITMINRHPKKSSRFILAAIVVFIIFVGLIVRPIRADDSADLKAAAVAAMQTWLTEIDQNLYPQSWKDASPSFQKAVTSDGWTTALNGVRTPLGKCTERKLASALHQTEVPSPTGPQKGDYVVAQFNSSFENLAYAVETVCFEKAPDGTWKAAGYYIKPKP
jgi:beta-lactamase regulating signal transducer with metallopeptidase domain